MLWWQTLIIIEVVHNFFGLVLACGMDSTGFQFVNPIWIYRHYGVNVFGAIILTILFNLICPIGSICYWFYKLCTVGRRKHDLR